MQGQYHWSNFYKRAELLGLSAYGAILILLSILRPFSLIQHIILFVGFAILFYIQKIRQYIPQYFFKYLKLKISGNIRNINRHNTRST